jgi:hypothetical protein
LLATIPHAKNQFYKGGNRSYLETKTDQEQRLIYDIKENKNTEVNIQQ